MAVQLNLTGRRVLITGAGQGVGRGLALAFATAGADAVVNDLRAERAETNGAGYAAAKAGAAPGRWHWKPDATASRPTTSHSAPCAHR